MEADEDSLRPFLSGNWKDFQVSDNIKLGDIVALTDDGSIEIIAEEYISHPQLLDCIFFDYKMYTEFGDKGRLDTLKPFLADIDDHFRWEDDVVESKLFSEPEEKPIHWTDRKNYSDLRKMQFTVDLETAPASYENYVERHKVLYPDLPVIDTDDYRENLPDYDLLQAVIRTFSLVTVRTEPDGEFCNDRWVRAEYKKYRYLRKQIDVHTKSTIVNDLDFDAIFKKGSWQKDILRDLDYVFNFFLPSSVARSYKIKTERGVKLLHLLGRLYQGAALDIKVMEGSDIYIELKSITKSDTMTRLLYACVTEWLKSIRRHDGIKVIFPEWEEAFCYKLMSNPYNKGYLSLEQCIKLTKGKMQIRNHSPLLNQMGENEDIFMLNEVPRYSIRHGFDDEKDLEHLLANTLFKNEYNSLKTKFNSFFSTYRFGMARKLVIYWNQKQRKALGPNRKILADRLRIRSQLKKKYKNKAVNLELINTKAGKLDQIKFTRTYTIMVNFGIDYDIDNYPEVANTISRILKLEEPVHRSEEGPNVKGYLMLQDWVTFLTSKGLNW